MLCVEIMKQAEEIDLVEWNYFLRGLAGMDRQRPAKPDIDWMKLPIWNTASDMNETVPAFVGILNDLDKIPVWVKMGTVEVFVLSIFIIQSEQF